MSRWALTETIEELMGRSIPERSKNWMTRCPFHEDDRPSFSIDLDRGLWMCFGCAEKGGLARLAALLGGEVDNARIAERLADLNVEEVEPDFTDLALSIEQEATSPELDQYLAGRGLDKGVVSHFRLGMAGNRIAMPYWVDGKVTGIKFRDAEGRKTSQPGSRYGLYNVNDLTVPNVILCEGESDVHAAWSRVSRHGLTDLVAVVGAPGATASTSTWETRLVDLQFSRRVFVAFDADPAGDRGSSIVLAVLGDKATRARPTAGKDVTDHLLAGGTFAEMGAGIDRQAVTPEELARRASLVARKMSYGVA